MLPKFSYWRRSPAIITISFITAMRQIATGLSSCYTLNMLFSLIIATVNRSTELAAFLDSIQSQAAWIYEVIVVDQNQDDRLVGLIGAYGKRLPLRHVRSNIRESSHARNLGLRLSSGDVVTFPDDDCIYPPDLLERVASRFAQQRDLALLSGPAVTPSGQFGSGRWHGRSGPLTIDNVWTSVIEFNLFIHRTALASVGGFDEELGVGAHFGSGEAADLTIRVMRSGRLAFYDTEINVIHPDKRLTEQAVSRAHSYGLGLGRILRRHYPVSRTTLSFFIRPLGGLLLGTLCFQPLKRRYYSQTFRGRLEGYLASTAMTATPIQRGLRSPEGLSGSTMLHQDGQ